MTISLVVVLGGLSFYWYNQHNLVARQAYIHTRGTMVMPFDLSKTTHSFRQTAEGGIQQITVKDPRDKDQIALIQTHLKKEADLFAQGNFSDPSTLHGGNMPGLSVLEQSKGKIQVAYTDLPDGAQLTYITDDPKIIDAVHMWFMAQLQDHGQDATGSM